MKKLEGFQRKYLRGFAHGLKPVVFIGLKGLTPEVLLCAEKHPPVVRLGEEKMSVSVPLKAAIEPHRIAG